MKRIVLAAVATALFAVVNSPSHATSVCSDQTVLLTLGNLYVKGASEAVMEAVRESMKEAVGEQYIELFPIIPYPKTQAKIDDWKKRAFFTKDDAIMMIKEDGLTTTCQLDSRNIIGTPVKAVLKYTINKTDSDDYYVTIIDQSVDADDDDEFFKDINTSLLEDAADAKAILKQKIDEGQKAADAAKATDAANRAAGADPNYRGDNATHTPIPQGQTALDVVGSQGGPPSPPVRPLRRQQKDPESGLY
jgi:hypothetical protein